MFDDQNQPQNKQQQPPANLPFGQPQSPFVSPQQATQQPPQPTYAQPVAQSQPAAPIADMFAETDPLAGGRVNPAGYPTQQFNPNQLGQPGTPGYPPAGSPMSDDLFGRRGFPWGKIVTIVIIVLVVVVGIGAIYYGFQYFASSATTKTTTTTTPPTVTTAPVVNTPAPVATTTIETPVATVPVTEEAKDSDGDGLTDVEEKALGTNPNIADTDADGLTDWAEVKIYKTAPLNPDTDTDGYKDGAEVINNYDPLIPGNARLLAVPKATSTN